jgi:hypothetical protein
MDVVTLQAIAERVAQGAALTDEDAALLLGTHDLIAIGMMADGVRRQIHGVRTTFVRVFEVHVGAIPAAVPAGLAVGELRLTGWQGDLDAACVAVAAARALAPSTPLSGFSLGDLAALHASDPSVYRRLKDSGLDAVAEAPLDGLAAPAADVAAAAAAGLLVERMTVHQGGADPVALCRRALELQQATGTFRAFAPLPRAIPAAEPTTGYDDVKRIAVTRLLVRSIPCIQVDWPLHGPKLAQVALTVGADDVDGVAGADTGALGPRRSALEEITRNIRAAGLEPVERNGRYEPVAASPDVR